MYQFKSGDRVRIREWDDMAAEFGVDGYGNIPCKFGFCSWMKYLCGLSATINRINPDRHVHFKDLSAGCSISTDMIELVTPISDISEDDFLNMLGLAKERK